VNRIINKLISHLSEQRKTLFLIDSLGAFSTAFFLFVITRRLNEYFGMPKIVLTYLSAIACCFCIYSTVCFIFIKGRTAISFIKIIGIANLLYCTLIIGLLIKYFPLLTIVGITYFVIEILVIYMLSYVELSVVARSKEKKMS
jgi:hypothetical protein